MPDLDHKAPCPSCGKPIPSFSAACMHCGAPTAGGSNERDSGHVRLLTIFHYVYAPLHALMFSFPLIHVTLGLLMVAGKLDERGHGPPAALGWVFVVFGGLVVLFGWSTAVFFALAGRWMSARRRHVACVVSSGLMCLFMPLGTVLGVFSLIVLLRPSVKASFR